MENFSIKFLQPSTLPNVKTMGLRLHQFTYQILFKNIYEASNADNIQKNETNINETKIPSSSSNSKDNVNIVKTGDSAPIAFFMILLLFSVVGIIFLKKKKF